MPIDITITHLSGSREHQTETHHGLPLKIGRAATCPVQFDAEKDIRVSVEHCEVREAAAVVMDNSRRNRYVHEIKEKRQREFEAIAARRVGPMPPARRAGLPKA